MSVLNVVLKRTPNFDQPIESKERLIFQCGYRRFASNPIFSQHTNGQKHKFERFFQPESTAVATFYGRIQFPPAPVLCFKEVNGNLVLVATGSLLSVNPERIILKRIVLSGQYSLFNITNCISKVICQVIRSKFSRDQPSSGFCSSIEKILFILSL